MRWLTASCLGTLMVALLPPLAFADVLDSNFHGAAISSVSDGVGVYTPGETYTVYMTLDAAPSTGNGGPWYPWNQPTQEYTVVISGTVDTYVTDSPAPGLFTMTLNTSAVDIYEDDTTTADFANPSTFSDGTLLLSGSTVDFQASGTIGQSFWGFSGSLNFSAGAGMGDLECVSSALFNDFADVFNTPAGYDESYDAEWNCEGTTTSVEESTWGRLKSFYR